MKPITHEEFSKIRDILKVNCGVALNDDQEYLVETRLAGLGKEIGAANFSELFDSLLASRERLLPKVIHLLTTHETFWFRDNSCWNTLERFILPKMFKRLEAGALEIRIWSTGCSTGQEPYSLAILIDELCRMRGTPEYAEKFSILGMDISEAAISAARTANYSTFDINRGLSEHRRNIYFVPEGKKWRLREDIRCRVEFGSINLMEDFKRLGLFDIVLCRNVIVYFSPELREKTIVGISRVMAENAMLLLGAAESLYGCCPDKLKKIEFEGGIYHQHLRNN
ncbi:MAG: hypothetical protein GY862_11185 [Gammaproteobacteria bacterium]|nr:hypothetical protein [Gammaproteobacteria bacterium]